jgi:hypothetical protein
VEKHGYWRRKQELEDAEEAILYRVSIKDSKLRRT